jgi:hypothetical protein
MKYFFFLLLILTTHLCFAQSRFLGISAGGSLYSGDLSPVNYGDNIQNIGTSFGVSYKQELSDRFGFRLMLSRNSVEAADSLNQLDPASISNPPTVEQLDLVNRIVRNLSFQNTITEFSLLAEYKILKINKLDVIVSGGPAVFRHSPKAFDPVTTEFAEPVLVELQSLRTEGQSFNDIYGLFQVSLPLGLQLQYAVTEKLSIGLEFYHRFVFTDYLDDASSSTYAPCADIVAISGPVGDRLADPSDFAPSGLTIGESPCSNPTGTPISRADPSNNDNYMSASVSVWYRLPDTRGKGAQGCPLPY